MSLNKSKRSVTIDLKTEEGKEIVYKMVEQSDIFVQNFLPKVTEKLGLDYESLKVINPKLIYASVSGYPHHSEQKNNAAFDLTI